ncbi:MAG: MBL fold metallo-hydrolase [Cyanobacteria bacterium J06639_14]
MIPSEILAIDDRPVQIVAGVGDHPKSSFVWVEDAKTVIMGDIAFGDTHAFIGDHRDFEGWITTLDAAKALDPKTVIVGHAEPAARYGAEALDAQIAWIEDLQSAIAQEDSPEAVEVAMIAKYPNYANDFIFQFSYGVERFSE